MTEETKPNRFSQAFRDMADRIDRNPESDFGGALLVSPPSGDPISIIFLDSKPSLIDFWGIVGNKVNIAGGEVAENEKRKGPFR